MRTYLTSLPTALCTLLQLASYPCSAAPEDLDMTFAGDGKVTTHIPFGTEDEARGVVIQPDGKIVVAGVSTHLSSWDFAVVRYHADGSLDMDFDGDGCATTDFASSSDYGECVALQADGKIVVAGSIDGGGFQDFFGVARFNPDGSLDTGFDGDGKVTTDVGGFEQVRGVAVQGDGKIVVAGYCNTGTKSDIALVRYHADGSLDTDFDGDGKVTTAIGSDNDEATGVAVQSDGKIVVVGASMNLGSWDFALVRYHADGSLDTAFNTSGKVVIPSVDDDRAYSVALQTDGKIVVVGSHYSGDYEVAVVRCHADGSLDTDFGTNGSVITVVGVQSDMAYPVALQPDGKIVVATSVPNGLNNDFLMLRYHPDGSLDTGLNGTGMVTTPVGSGEDRAYAVAIQSDGKIVLAGQSHNGSNNDFAVVRYEGVTAVQPPVTQPTDNSALRRSLSKKIAKLKGQIKKASKKKALALKKQLKKLQKKLRAL